MYKVSYLATWAKSFKQYPPDPTVSYLTLQDAVITADALIVTCAVVQVVDAAGKVWYDAGSRTYTD